MRVISNNNIPIKMWINDIEDGALTQIINLSNLPFAFKHIAIMPDCHQGYGMPIGAVLATKNIIIPNAVGVDIGCGMCALKTSITSLDIETLKNIMSEIRLLIPLGFEYQKDNQDKSLMPKDYDINCMHILKEQYNAALKQIGTLGGGNHFIEIQKDNEDYIWVMIHSGSRNLGKKVADYYNKKAVFLNDLWFSKVEKEKELAFFPIETKEAKEYINEMNYCIDFAFANRMLIMENIKKCFNKVLDNKIEYNNIINIAHNYARHENHFGHNVLVHRKGATSAKLNEVGIIPGSQGTKSYIVKGLGNKESFESCSHGAGRKMGRGQAQRELNLDAEIKQLNDKGIIHSIRNIKDLDEATGAYKSIDEVMENQKDLVEIITELKPIAVIKG